jgi:hypothetical protein
MTLVLAALAAWRLARMVVLETGPFMAFERLRYQIAKHTIPGSWIDEGMGCVLCVSFWTSFIFAIFVSTSFADFTLNWLGIAGGAALLHLITEHN